ncbi:MAG: hypothetical protein KKD77_24620, partial [Gammaproteobacteria bacterium]|nr:hypothetical protein [Gammaproteobacteria bacterium]
MNLGQFFRDLAEVVGTYNDKEKIDLRVLGQQIENVAKWIDNTGSKQRIQNAKIEHAFIPGGEIRFGKGTPGSSTNPFTGIRISDTGMTYGGTTYYIVNVFEDEVTSGTNID